MNDLLAEVGSRCEEDDDGLQLLSGPRLSSVLAVVGTRIRPSRALS